MKRVLIFAALAFLIPNPVLGDDAKDDGDKKKETPKVMLPGVFESTRVHEVKFDTKQVASAKIKKLVPHGSTVEKGSLLFSVESKDYNKQLKEVERKLNTSELTLKETHFGHEQFRETQKLDRAAAERTWQAAKESYKGYLEFDKDYAVESAKFGLKQSQQSLEYLEEDLRQLERMYEEDELTEESEELVLTRARRAVESAKFRLRNTEVQVDRTLTQTLPDDEAAKKEAFERAKMAYEKAKLTADIARKKKELELQAANDSFNKEKEAVDELRSDFERLVVNSPANGIVFYGELDRGQIADKPSTLEVGSSIAKDQVVMTVVNPRKLQVRMTVSEKEIGELKAGMSGIAKPTAASDRELPVTVVSVDTVPYAKGKYDCVLSVKGKTDDLLPTMTCTVTFDLPDTSGDEKQEDGGAKTDKDEATKKDQ
ncbi:MAG: HlyD family efflux transporter periplasmic adaptor subunit [Planctomycetales bacterium]|nr:HlyD family efflux transporter periplasmic adaptor subunit [Planctomycetales bacterium]